MAYEGRCACGGERYRLGAAAPDVHIFTRSKLPWVVLPEGAKAYDVFYADPGEVWMAEARLRWKALLAE